MYVRKSGVKRAHVVDNTDKLSSTIGGNAAFLLASSAIWLVLHRAHRQPRVRTPSTPNACTLSRRSALSPSSWTHDERGSSALRAFRSLPQGTWSRGSRKQKGTKAATHWMPAFLPTSQRANATWEAGKCLKSVGRRCSHEQRIFSLSTTSFECLGEKRQTGATQSWRARVFVILLAISVSHRLGVHLALFSRSATSNTIVRSCRSVGARERGSKAPRSITAVRLNTLLAWTRQQNGSIVSSGGITDNMYSARFHEIFPQHSQTRDLTNSRHPSIHCSLLGPAQSCTYSLIPTSVSPSFRFPAT